MKYLLRAEPCLGWNKLCAQRRRLGPVDSQTAGEDAELHVLVANEAMRSR